MREVIVGEHTYRRDDGAWRLIGGARSPVCGPRISALLNVITATVTPEWRVIDSGDHVVARNLDEDTARHLAAHYTTDDVSCRPVRVAHVEDRRDA